VAIAIVALSTLLWPALELGVFWLRFGHLPPEGAAASLVFAPMGLVAGIVAAVLVALSSSTAQMRAVLWGYLIASPFAFLGALLGGLVLPGVWGPLVSGGIPLVLGSIIGYVVGRTPAQTEG